jgi:hypothetical protein
MPANSITDIKELMKLMTDNKITNLKWGDLEITKVRHDQPVNKQEKSNNLSSIEEDINDPDAILFHSSGGNLSQKQIEQLAYDSPLAVRPREAETPRKKVKGK